MDSRFWNQIRTIFEEALDTPSADRPAFLDRACAGNDALRSNVDRLLEHEDGPDGTTDLIESGIIEGVLSLAEPDVRKGVRIGSYRVLKTISAGGMGTVFEAEQDQPRRKVALKLLRSGSMNQETRQRFKHEAEILARLAHPNIAQIYEAGTWLEGSGNTQRAFPYFAMEMVVGARTFTDYVREEECAIQQTLNLFGKICEAIHHGHQRGVVHRDLKPGNVLVNSDGVPKVIDFGVARISDSDSSVSVGMTQTGQVVGTVRYMSPEQVSGDVQNIDSRTDVYSLGLILDETLSGSLPYDIDGLTFPQAAKCIMTKPPRELGSVVPDFRGDLTWILCKALEKEPEDRYLSPLDLWKDLERFLADEPVNVGPPSRRYRIRKFVRRNRRLVIGLAMVFATLSISLVLVLAALKEAKQSDRIAQQKQVRAKELNEYVYSLFGKFRDGEGGAHQMVTGLLDRALAQKDVVGNDPDAQYKLLTDVSDQFQTLGIPESSEEALVAALQLAKHHFGPRDIRTLNAEFGIGAARCDRGDVDTGLAIAGDAVGSAIDEVGDADPNVVGMISKYAALLLFHRGSAPKAEEWLLRAQQLNGKLFGEESLQSLKTGMRLAMFYLDRGRTQRASEIFSASEAAVEKASGPNSVFALEFKSNYAQVLAAEGKTGEAIVLLRDVLDLRQQKSGYEDPNTNYAMVKLAAFLRQSGQFAEAEDLLMKASGVASRVYGKKDIRTLHALAALGKLRIDQNRFNDAEVLFRGVREAGEEYGDENPLMLESLHLLGLTLLVQGELEEGEACLVSELELQDRLRGAASKEAVAARLQLANLYLHTGRLDELDRMAAVVIESLDSARTIDPMEELKLRLQLAGTLKGAGSMDAAVEVLSRAEVISLSLLGAEHPMTLHIRTMLGEIQPGRDEGGLKGIQGE